MCSISSKLPTSQSTRQDGARSKWSRCSRTRNSQRSRQMRTWTRSWTTGTSGWWTSLTWAVNSSSSWRRSSWRCARRSQISGRSRSGFTSCRSKWRQRKSSFRISSKWISTTQGSWGTTYACSSWRCFQDWWAKRTWKTRSRWCLLINGRVITGLISSKRLRKLRTSWTSAVQRSWFTRHSGSLSWSCG